MIGQNKIYGIENSQVKGSTELQVDCCYAVSRHNLWEMILFIVVSIYAYAIKDLNLFNLASEPLRQILGCPPPAYMISIALVVYFASAVILTLTALLKGDPPGQKWSRIGYRSAFYFFYAFSGTIFTNFLAVLCVGLFLYGLDQCHIWVYNNRSLKDERNLRG
jgi:hypothetical protein